MGERAGVSESTVQRYFPGERKLRDVVLQHLREALFAAVARATPLWPELSA